MLTSFFKSILSKKSAVPQEKEEKNDNRKRKTKIKAPEKHDVVTTSNPDRMWLLSDKEPWNHSWVDNIPKLPEEIQVNAQLFEELWQIHPEKVGEVFVFGQFRDTPRWQQSFGKSYYFSGMYHQAWPLEKHEYLIRLQTWVRGHAADNDPHRGHAGGEKKNPNWKFDQVLINWYADGKHYIGPHSDDESQLVPNSPIYSFSFGETRRFVIKIKKQSMAKFKSFESDFPKSIVMKDNSCLVMGGQMQKHFTHEVPKVLSKKITVGRRINITFRCFR